MCVYMGVCMCMGVCVCVCMGVCTYIDTYLSPYLCEYRKGYCAQHAILTLLEKWRVALDNKGLGGAILMDLSKAFDTLNHELLIAIFRAYGFSHCSLRLIYSYLSNRWQRTKIKCRRALY